MKIALLSEKYTPDLGGLAISTGRLGDLLTGAGYDVHVFAPTTTGLAPSEQRTFRTGPVTVHRFGAHKRTDDTLTDWFEFIIEEHHRKPFDVLQAYFLTGAGFVATYAGNYLGLPSVVSARGNDLERAVFDPGRVVHVLHALKHASAVTTNTSELRRKARALVRGLDVTLIPNGIDAECFRPTPANEALTSQLGLTAKSTTSDEGRLPVIGFVGELREKKGLATLLSGYAQVTKKRPAILLIVGEVRPGDDKARFDELRAAISSAKIVVTGAVPHRDLPAYYALMDVFVMPSLRDGLPNALLEAMACERPVIATSVGGIPDALRDDENGKIVPVNDVRALSEAIESLLTDKVTAIRYGQSARETIVKKFTPQAELEGNLNIYKKLGLKA